MKARLALVVLTSATFSLAAQDIISAHAGYVNYQEGRPPISRRQLQDGERFSSVRHRTELLLTPGSILRLDRDTDIRMISTRVADPQVELVWGLAGLEVVELPKHTHVALSWGGYRDDKAIIVDHNGLFRFKAGTDTLRLAVQQGSLRLPGSKIRLKKGQSVELRSEGVSAVVKFNPKDVDLFDLWSSDRAGQLAAASFRSARGYNANGLRGSIWTYNALLGGFTFFPYSSYTYSPWGYAFYSPHYVQTVVARPQSWNPPGYSASSSSPQPTVSVAAPQVSAPPQVSMSPPPAHHPVPSTPVKQ